MNIERWALPLFKSVGLVPKSSKTVARSQIKCASCEICSYHLGLESPDLSLPFKDMYICDNSSRTYHWQCLLKTSCCNATEREAIDANDSWACPACINLNQNEKESRIHSEKRDCGSLMETNLGARRSTKHVCKLQAEPQ
jgi:ubiquitin C-terminal hydrolase